MLVLSLWKVLAKCGVSLEMAKIFLTCYKYSLRLSENTSEVSWRHIWKSILTRILFFCLLGVLPVELSQLKKLEVLIINKNHLKVLPLGLFTSLSHLKTLSLASNQLTAFPEGLGTSKHLDVVDLSNNKIRSLPESVGDLQMVELNMNKNQVALLPASLARCPRLKVLRLEENCLALDAVNPELLKESQISLLAVDGNLFETKQLREAEGYDQVCHIKVMLQESHMLEECSKTL